MAIKPTIYKMSISISDLDRNYYGTENLTLALHPSETMERMMARVMAYCLNVEAYLKFSKGLSAVEEPDVWARTLDDQISLWIDIGEPSVERVKKAVSLSKLVKVYSFNTKSDVWWDKQGASLSRYPIEVLRFDYGQIKKFATLVERTMVFSVTISGNSAFIATAKGECELAWTELKKLDI